MSIYAIALLLRVLTIQGQGSETTRQSDVEKWILKQGGTVDTRRNAAKQQMIRAVDLTDSKVRDGDLSRLSSIQGLRILHLANTAVTGKGFRKGGFVWLRTLNLNDSNVDAAGLNSISRLPAVENLFLSKTKIDDKASAAFARKWNLKKLDISGTKVGNVGLAQLRNQTKLESLNVAGTNVTSLVMIGGIRTLKDLAVASTKVGDGSTVTIGSLKRLTYLNLAETSVTDAGVRNLRPLKRLETLLLDGCDVTDRSIEFIVRCFPKMEFVGVSRTKISKRGVSILGRLRHLKFLYLSKQLKGSREVRKLERDHERLVIRYW